MPRIENEELEVFVTDALVALGAPSGVAGPVAESLVRADLRGYHTHGVSMLPLYAEMVEVGAIDPAAEPEFDHETPTTCRIDGRSTFGQYTARLGVEAVSERANEEGVGVVGIRNGTHVGRLGEWTERAAETGLVSFLFVNTSGGARTVTPPGVGKRMLSTNPMSVGIPTFDALECPIVLDMATSQAANGQVHERNRQDGELLAEWTTTPFPAIQSLTRTRSWMAKGRYYHWVVVSPGIRDSDSQSLRNSWRGSSAAGLSLESMIRSGSIMPLRS